MSSEPPYSQSSLDGSTDGCATNERPFSVDGFPPISDDPLGREMTPSTSLSNPSSQERMRNASPVDPNATRPGPAAERRHRTSIVNPNLKSLSIHSPISYPYALQAQKRTADGEIKTPDSSPGMSPVEARESGHSRNTSATSKGSQIGDLSNQLRTRLSYAMYKVQNGWQSHSLRKLEGMTSQQASPVSNQPDLRPSNYFPPGYERAPPDHEHGAQASSDLKSGSALYLQGPMNGTSGHESIYHNAYGLSGIPSSLPSGPTLDSIWQTNHTEKLSKQILTQHPSDQAVSSPSLAPPADILPRNPRRSNPNQVHAPSLHTSSLKQPGQPDPSNSWTRPMTPPRQSSKSGMRTSSQKAAMEKDAVETLLFMSSPGNSGHVPQYQVPVSPRRNSTVSTPKRVGFAHCANSNSPAGSTQLQGGMLPPSRSEAVDTRRLTDNAEIDRVLDEMPDHDSSSEDDGPSVSRSVLLFGR